MQSETTLDNIILFANILLLGSGFLINWIKEKIKEHYIKELTSELATVAKINHDYTHRIGAIENGLRRISNMVNYSTEFGEEFGNLFTQTKELVEEYNKKISSIQVTPLEKTNNYAIDNLLEYMQSKAVESNIEFNLKLNDSINYMVQNLISQSKLETLLGDHINDAIIAVNSGENMNKSILVMLGLMNNCYELAVYDTGVEFEIDTLLRLGLERVTTYAGSGGTGQGFMTTFETLEETKASLIIEEYKIPGKGFTKAVIIRFDNKREYKIISYRAKEIQKLDTEGKMVVENLKNKII
jgi:hypothetical protein